MDPRTDMNSSLPLVYGPLPGLVSDAVHGVMVNIILGFNIVAGLFATGTNIITFIVLYKMGFAESANVSYAALAISDIGIALTTFIAAAGHFLAEYFPVPFDNNVLLAPIAYPHSFLSKISALITMYISFERYLCVLIPLKIKTIITPKRTFIVMAIVYIAMFCPMPIGYLHYPIGWRFDVRKNRTLLGIMPVTDPTILLLADMLLSIIYVIIPLVSFISVVVFTVLLAISLQKSVKWRDSNNFSSGGKKGDGEETTNKNSKEARAVKMVIIIATVFIVANIPSSAQIITIMVEPEFSYIGRYYRLFDITGIGFFGIDAINAAANVFIYYKMSNKFRTTMQTLFCRQDSSVAK